MKELEQLKEKLEAERPVSWSEFPDIGLYKDQIISYMMRQLISFENDGMITSAMLNNYIKDKLLPRADGKKYSREHLAGLTEICLIKQVLSVRDTGLLLHKELEKSDPEKFYSKFRQILDKALAMTTEKIVPDWDAEVLSDIALRFAVSSYCDKLVCERLLEIIRSKESKAAAEEQKKADKKPEESDKKTKNPEKKQDKE